MQEQLQAIDVLFEVRDARLPLTSSHPKSKELLGTKPKVLVLCKEDLADGAALRRWLKTYNEQSEQSKAIALSLKQAKGQDRLLALATELCKEKIEARKRKGLLPRPVRVAVFGLPNVGKSSLINWMIGKKKAAVANTPGVTRGNAWIRVHPQVELLDTPGILPQYAFRGEQALKLAICNILPGDHYDIEEVAAYGIEQLAMNYPESLGTYGLKPESIVPNDESTETAPRPTADDDASTDADSAEQRSLSGGAWHPDASNSLDGVARARACLKAGGVLDRKRAAAIFLAEFRSGKLGKVVLDKLD